MDGKRDDLTSRIDDYLNNRLEQYRSWYDRKAVKMKNNYIRSRMIAAVGAVIIPILSNTSFTLTFEGNIIDVPKIAVTLIGLLVAILLAVEGILHHKELWQNYRATEQFLQAQSYLFRNRVDDYAGLGDEEAFKHLVSRVERAIKEENEVTLNVLARSDTGSTNTSGGS
jgi:hypothetical protein